jgi:anti-sigma regulatory factor (Ser/Thr protein kinase)
MRATHRRGAHARASPEGDGNERHDAAGEYPRDVVPPMLFRRRYPGDRDSLRRARRECSAWASTVLGDPTLTDNMALIVGELAANAVQAAPGVEFEVSIVRNGDAAIDVSVRNAGRAAMLPPQPWRAPPATAPHGRGLAIVSSLADAVNVAEDDSTLTVTATMTPGTVDARHGNPTG